MTRPRPRDPWPRCTYADAFQIWNAEAVRPSQRVKSVPALAPGILNLPRGSERTDKGDGESTAEEGDHVDGELGAVGLVCVVI